MAQKSLDSVASLGSLVSSNRPDLGPYETLYKHFHSHPELSLQEEQTAATAASHLRKLGVYDIHEHIGGHGFAAILKNGPGATVLLRADMDALPVEELTNLPYASKVTMKDTDGVTKPVMHACGHDMHVTCLLAAAELLANVKDGAWQGTLVLVFQPNEERAGGAQAMIDDGLYRRVPVPDVVLGQHVMPTPAGSVGTRVGTMMAAADSLNITFYGRGGHASMPNRTIDPVMMAAHTVVRLQTIVSREVNPSDMAVVTVGSMQAGKTENIIADRAEIKVNVRTIAQETRKQVLSSIKRIVKAESEASGAPKPPTIEETSSFPATVNDEDLTKMLSEAFGWFSAFDPDLPRVNASEDFSILGTSQGKPCCFWMFGGVDQKTWDEAKKAGRLQEDIPVNHSPFFAPVIQPTMQTGVDALAMAALACFKNHDTA
ncbi:hypothetical protein MMC24_007572 [Lignoscripta atroalba]|nr:hypothetical protein [Lignoscripta atroalba]